MIQALQILPQILTSNTDNINFSSSERTRSATCCGWLQYTPGTSNFTIIGGGKYEVSFNANVTSETAGPLALALKSSLGDDVEGTEMNTVIAAAGEYQNISFTKIIELCPRVNSTFAIGSLATIGGVTPAVETEIPTIKDANLIIRRLSGN